MIYEFIVGTLGRLTGSVPFSVAEILLYILAALLLVSSVRLIIKLFQRKAGKAEMVRFALKIACVACVLLLLYTVNCGLNYHRPPFTERIGLETGDYTVDELQKVCMVLTAELNSLAGDVTRDEDGVMVLTGDTGSEARNAMINLAEDYECLGGYYPKPKKLIFPWILSVQKITGIYSPFTVEANYNNHMTAYNIPFTACHELSHLKGFMREEEANFIGWLACRQAEQVDFQYSGSLRGWISCMNALYRADYDAWARLRAELDSAVEADLQANREYWAQYDGKIAETAEKINDGYLKANGQTEGIKSYGRMCDLIVAWMNKYECGKVN